MIKDTSGDRRHFVGATAAFYDGDVTENIHMTVCFTLDHVIDLHDMQTALDRTMEVYPFLKDALVKIGDEIYFESCSAPLCVFIGERVASPGKVSGHVFTVTCHGNSFSLSGYHSVFDGGGITRLVCTLLLQYCQIHFGSTYHIAGIPEPDGKEHPEYAEDTALHPLGEFQKSHGDRPKEGTFPIPEFSVDENGHFQYAEVLAPSEDFMKVCRNLGASPSILLFLLIAKAVYKAHPEQEGPLTSMLTVDIRKALGMETLAPCSAALYLSVTRQDIQDAMLPETVKECRRVLDSQRSVDYAKTAMDEVQRMGGFQSGIPFTVISTYMGRMELGECAKHITDFTAYNCTTQTVNLFELNGYFRFQILFGKGTASYAAIVCDELKAMGVNARISKEATLLSEEAHDSEIYKG